MTCKLGHKHRSAWECAHCEDIQKRPNTELIKYEPCVWLTDARLLYKPDFFIFDGKFGQEVYEEMKGAVTPNFARNKRLWKHGYGPVCSKTGQKCILRIYKCNKLGIPYLYETVVPIEK